MEFCPITVLLCGSRRGEAHFWIGGICCEGLDEGSYGRFAGLEIMLVV